MNNADYRALRAQRQRDNQPQPYEPLVWVQVEPLDTPAHEMPGAKRLAREERALKVTGFDPDWDVKKCAQCGKVFKLTPGPGNWRKRVHCSAKCRKAASRAKSATLSHGFVSRETSHEEAHP